MAYVGSSSSWAGKRVDSLSASTTLDQDDSGKIILINTSGITITLPPLSGSAKVDPGWNCKIIANVDIAGNTDVNANSAATQMWGHLFNGLGGDDGAGDSGASADDGVRFAAASIQGDFVELVTDGTSWFANGAFGVDAAMAFIDNS